MRRTRWLATLLLVGGCTAPSTPPARYAGYYAMGFEEDAFYPCEQSEGWWVTEAPELRRRYSQLASEPYQRLYAVVRGKLSAPGHYGHLGRYTHELAIGEVIELRAPQPGDCAAAGQPAPSPGTPQGSP